MTDTYVIELLLKTTLSDENYLAKIFVCKQIIQNTLIRYVRKQLKKLRSDKRYRELLKEYSQTAGTQHRLIGKELNDIVRSYGLSEYGLMEYEKIIRRKYAKYIRSNVGQKIATEVWRSVASVLYKNGRTVHYKKIDDIFSFEGKTNDTGIIYKDGLVKIGSIVVEVLLPKKKQSLHYIYETTALADRTKYCRIVRKAFPNGWHYYVQLIQEGVPPTKGLICRCGRCGIDIGVSTIAAQTEVASHLDTLDEGISSIEKQIARINRQLDRSRRATNPDNYNADGTVKRKCKWYKSNHYKKLEMKVKTLYRKRQASLKQLHERYVNMLLKEADTFFVEQMHFNGLAKKAELSKNDKGKFKSRKRYGHSIQIRAPSQLLAILKRKAKQYGAVVHEVNTYTFKASQYDHTTDTYEKKKLSKRYNCINGEWVQRDIYSAYLLMNSDDTLQHTDRDACIKHYPEFKQMHDKCIEDIKARQIKRPSSFGF